ncbi:TPA: AAA family ATPase [Aeromonas hydrophila]|uniref:AAA family ATPase n=1 Tax=Aeromonas hydrophila TaxID=644 RepID=A0AAD3UA58_AERHY|nr:AAA family ATPase [Aeromonas hydrophila]
MDISIKNFGTILEANVKIGGLTVIAGENDTGKSTVGKILFSLVKASARYEENLQEDKETKVLALAEKIYFSLRRKVNFNDNAELRDLFHPRRVYEQVRFFHDKAISDRVNALMRALHKGISSSIDHELIAIVTADLNEIKNIIFEQEDQKTAIYKAVRRAFYSEFRGDVFPKGPTNVEHTHVYIKDGESPLINIVWTKDGINRFDYYDDMGFEDATFVDTPSVIQFHNFTDVAKTLFDISGKGTGFTLPLHIKDLSEKIKASIYTYNLFDDYHHINQNLSNTYKGRLYYDKDSSEFLLDRGNYKVNACNVASGIKSLGIFDILVQSGHASPSSLLILDEPEINLHPKWQIEYARAICDLIEIGANIIVTTHSPYILEALKGFCDRKKLAHNFYLAQKVADRAILRDITGNISPAINMLSSPLFELNEELYNDF